MITISKKIYYALPLFALIIGGYLYLNNIRITPSVTLSNTKAATPTVLQASDFIYLGAMRFPNRPGDPTWDTHQGGILAGRVVDGHVHLFSTGGTDLHLGEFLDTENYNTDYTQAPRMPLVAYYGYVDEKDFSYLDRTTGQKNCQQNAIQSVYTRSMFWSEANQMLYMTYLDSYNTNYYNDWMMFALSLNSTNATHTAYGPWRITLGSNHSTGSAQQGFAIYGLLPDGSVGVGSTLVSGVGGGPWGPNLYGGLTLPTAASPQGCNVDGPNAPDSYVNYGYGGTQLNLDGTVIAGQVFQPLRRNPAGYVWPGDPTSTPWMFLNPDKNGGVGSWTSSDYVYTANWINLPDKVGVLFAGERAGGKIWYGANNDQPGGDPCIFGQGNHANSYEPFWWIYDPTDLMRVKNGQVNSWEISPSSQFNPSDAIAPIRTACGGGALNNFKGSYFNPVTRKLYISVEAADDSYPGLYQHLIHVYYIRDANNPYTPTPTASPTSTPSPTSSFSATPSPTASPTTSPAPLDGSIPPDASFTDSGGHIWTFSGGHPFRDGVITNGGGFQLIYTGGYIYLEGYDHNWYRYNGSDYTYIGAKPTILSSTPLIGDLNHDGIVNSLDWSLMNSKWFTNDATADLNHDGLVNSLDFSLLNANWLKTQ